MPRQVPARQEAGFRPAVPAPWAPHGEPPAKGTLGRRRSPRTPPTGRTARCLPRGRGI